MLVLMTSFEENGAIFYTLIYLSRALFLKVLRRMALLGMSLSSTNTLLEPFLVIVRTGDTTTTHLIRLTLMVGQQVLSGSLLYSVLTNLQGPPPR